MHQGDRGTGTGIGRRRGQDREGEEAGTAAAAAGATAVPPPPSPPTSLKLGGVDIGAPSPFILNHGRNPRPPSARTELTGQLEKGCVMVAGREAQATLRFTQRMQEDIRQAKEYLKIAQQRMKA